MTPLVLGLVLASACVHVGWNVLAKACRDKQAFGLLTTLGGGLALAAPFVWMRLSASEGITPEIWGLAALSGLFQAAYTACLFACYALEDFSAVYPVTRGAAPVLVMLLAGRLVDDHVTWVQGLGVLGLAVGSWAVTAAGAGSRAFSGKGLALAGAAVAATAGYTLTDRMAMRAPGAPGAFEYLFLTYIFLAAALAAFVLWRRPPASLALEWKGNAKSVILVSLGTPLSYGLAVLAMRYGNVVLVSALRNVGIVLSAAAGMWFLRERVGLARVVGSALIFAGLLALSLPLD